MEGRGRRSREWPHVARAAERDGQPEAENYTGAVQADQRHLLFVWATTGYDLAERDGKPPAAGEEVTLDDAGRRFVVVKVAQSPLPGDDRRCAYLQPL